MQSLLVIKSENVTQYNPVDFELTIWPFENKEFDYFREINKNRFLNFSYINKIYSIEKSENNSEALVISGELIVLNDIDKTKPHIFTFRDVNIPVELRFGQIEKDNLAESKELKTVEYLKENEKSYMTIYLGLITLALAIIIFLIFLVLKGRSKRSAVITFNILDSLKKIESKGDFLELYENREYIKNVLKDNKDLMKELETIIHNVIFKKNEDISRELGKIKEFQPIIKKVIENGNN